MCHSDDDGLVLPPKLATWPVMAMPIFKNQDEHTAVMSKLDPVINELRSNGIGVQIDARDNVTPGFKFAECELVGYPVRIEMGPKDLAKNQVVLTKRHNREKLFMPIDQVAKEVPGILDTIQKDLFKQAKDRMTAGCKEVNSYDEFKKFIEADEGFALVHWAGDTEDEKRVQEETKATHRVIPMDWPKEKGKCMLTGKESSQRVVFAKAY
jgi:prolyl-tRNA synthetase